MCDATNASRMTGSKVKEFDIRISNIALSEIRQKQQMLQRQVSENLLEMSINIDEKKISDLDNADNNNPVHKGVSIKFHRNRPDSSKVKDKSAESLRSIKKERLPFEHIKRNGQPINSARQLQNSSKRPSHHTHPNPSNDKPNKTFNVLLETDKPKKYHILDKHKTGSYEKKNNNDNLYKSARNLSNTLDIANGHAIKASSFGRLKNHRVSADQIDFNFSKRNSGRNELLRNVKNYREGCENSTIWAELFKKACDKKKIS